MRTCSHKISFDSTLGMTITSCYRVMWQQPPISRLLRLRTNRQLSPPSCFIPEAAVLTTELSTKGKTGRKRELDEGVGGIFDSECRLLDFITLDGLLDPKYGDNGAAIRGKMNWTLLALRLTWMLTIANGILTVLSVFIMPVRSWCPVITVAINELQLYLIKTGMLLKLHFNELLNKNDNVVVVVSLNCQVTVLLVNIL